MHTGFGGRTAVKWGTAILFFLASIQPGLAATPGEAERGLEWLQAQVNGEDGSLGGEAGSVASSGQNRAEALATLARLSTAPQSLTFAVSSGDSITTPALARQIIALRRAGQDVAVRVASLTARQNPDGGFGETAGSLSNALDTAWALLAFKAASHENATALQRAVAFLSNSINHDGGLATPAGTSRVYVSAYGLLALAAHRHRFDLTAPISEIHAWLEAQRDAEGSYGEIMLNAVAALALATASTDAAVYADAIDALKQTQAESGSWEEDPFLTALAIRALVGVSAPPIDDSTGRVTGTVIDAVNHAVVSGATVSIGGVQVVTGIAGDFSIDHVAPGDHVLSVSKAGYALAQRSVTIAGGGASSVGTVELSPAPETAIVRGQLSDAMTGATVSAAEVQVTVDGHSPVSVAVDPTGHYQLAGLAPGAALVVVSAENYKPASTALSLSAGGVYVYSPSLHPDEEPVSTAALHGQVSDAETGEVLAGAAIAISLGDAGTFATTTAADGFYRFDALPSGEAAISVTLSGYRTVSATAQLVAGQTHVLSPSLFPESAEVPVNASVQGRLLNADDGTPVAGASVVFSSSLVTTGSDGAFVIDGLPVGELAGHVQAAGYQPVELTAVLGAGTNAIGTIELQPAETMASLAGTVIDAVNGMSIAGAAIAAGGKNTTTGDDGSFELFELEPGAVTIEITANGYQASTLTGVLNPGTNHAGDIRLSASAATVTLGGLVIDEITGEPLPGAIVHVQGTDQQETTDAAGKFRIEGIAETQFHIVIEAAGYIRQTVAFSTPEFGNYTTDVSLQPNDASGIDLEVATNLGAYDPFSEVEITARVTNRTADDRDLVLVAIVLDAERNVVAELPVLPLTLDMNLVSAVETVPANSAVDLTTEWYNLDAPAGEYFVVMRATDPDSGQVIAESANTFLINAKAAIGGDITLDPPIAQAGINQPVSITAHVANYGNVPVPPTSLALEVVLETPDTGVNPRTPATISTLFEGSPLDFPADAVSDPAGNVYFINGTGSNQQILRLSPDGQVVLAADPALPSYETMVDVALDDTGKIWVISSRGIVYGIKPDGTYTSHATGLNSVKALDIDANGDFIVTGYLDGLRALVRVTPDGGRTVLVRGGFDNPFDVVADGDALLVTSQNGNSIWRVGADGGITRPYSGLSYTRGMTRDADGNLYVATAGSASVIRIDGAGNITNVANGIPNPQFLDIDPQGNLLITTPLAIYRAEPDGATDIFARSVASSPWGMAYDSNGNLYIANTAPQSLSLLTADGGISHVTSALSGPRDVEQGPDGSIYVVEAGAEAIGRFASGEYRRLSTELDQPIGLAFDPAGALYVAERSGNKVVRIEGDGTRTTVLQSFVGTPIKPLIRADGALLIANAYSIGIVEPGKVGRLLVNSVSYVNDATLTEDGSLYVLLNGRYIEHVDDEGGRTRVADVSGIRAIQGGGAGEIFYVDSSRRLVKLELATGDTQNLAVIPAMPVDLVRDSAGAFYVSTSTGEIYKVSGAVVSGIANYYSAPAMALDASDRLYVYANYSRVDRISQGLTETLITNPGQVSGIEVASDGRILLAQPSAQMVSEHAADGTYLDNLAGFSGITDVEWAWGSLLISTDQGIYQLRSDGNPRRFIAGGAYTLEWDGARLFAGGYSSVHVIEEDGDVNPFFSTPDNTSVRGIAIGPNGEIAVSGQNDHRIMFLDADGELISSTVGIQGAKGIAVADDGTVYVADFNTRKVLRFLPGKKVPDIFANLSFNPTGLLLAPDGGFHISAQNALYKLGDDGVVTEVARQNGTYGQGLASWNGEIFVADLNGYIRKAQGGNLDVFAAGIGTGNDVLVSTDGPIYVADADNGVVTRYSEDVLYPVAADLFQPQNLAFADDGSLLVAGRRSMHQVDSDGDVTALGVAPVFNNNWISGIAWGANDAALVLTQHPEAILSITLPLELPEPAPGTVVFTATANTSAIPLGEGAVEVDFGAFTPEYGGDYAVRLVPQTGNVAGQLENRLHVGPHASATVIADEVAVPSGESTVGVQVGVEGADFATLSKVDVSNLTRVASSVRPRGMGADADGNILFFDASAVRRIEPDGQVVTLYQGSLSSFGTLPVDAQGTAYVVDSQDRLVRVHPDGTHEIVAVFPKGVVSHVMDSQGRIVAWLDDSTVVRLESDGSFTTLLTPGVTTPQSRYSMTIDGKDNLYLLDRSNTLYRLDTQGRLSVFLADPRFEYEGMPIAGDCSENLFVAPFIWDEVEQFGEEYTLTQIFGRTGEVATLLNGQATVPRLTDMDHLVYDRFAGRLLIWTDVGGSPIYSIPVTCGAIDVDLHYVVEPDQALQAFNVAPDAEIEHADGAIEYVWNLKDVTNLGRGIRFDVALSGLTLGEHEPLAREAFLVFRNTFTTDDIRLPLTVPSVSVTGAVTLDVSTDQASYPASAEVLAAVTLDNPALQPLSGQLAVRVVDGEGAPVIDLLDQGVTLESGQTTLQVPFNTGAWFAGSYSIEATFVDNADYLQATAETPFEIVASGEPGQGAALNLSVTTDAARYPTIGTVRITGRAQSVASNYLFENLQLTLTVTDPAGTPVFTGFGNIPQLLPGALQDRLFLQNLHNVPPGDYTATLTVDDAYDRQLATASAQFEVYEDIATLIRGDVGVAHGDLYSGDSQVCTDSITNLGDRTIDLLTRHRVIRLDQEAEIGSADEQVAVEAGQTLALTQAFSTDGYAEGDYSCLLQAEIDGAWQTLDFAAFHVAPPPIEIHASLLAGDRGRVLALLDPACADSDPPEAEGGACDADPYGPDAAAPLPIQRAHLEAVLDAAGWEYTIVTSAEAFEQAFASKGYELFAMFNEQVKLPAALQLAVVEDIAAGRGLLVAGNHDRRNGKLEQALGIQSLGKNLDVETLVVQPFANYPGSDIAFNVAHAPNAVRLEGAQTLGAFHLPPKGNKTPDPEPALTRNAHGEGIGIYASFDWPAQSALLGDTGELADLLAAGLDAAHTEPYLPVAGRVFPLHLVLENAGMPTPGEVRLALPPGSVLVDGSPGITVTDGVAVWPFALNEAEQQGFTLWLRLPETAGPYTLEAVIYSGAGEDLVEHVRTQTVLNVLPQE